MSSAEPLERSGKCRLGGKPGLLLRIFAAFFKIGAFTFGGGWAMVPLIQKTVVDRNGWLEASEFVDVLAVAQSGPGPIAINTAVITGYKIMGLGGAMAATLGATLPSFIVLLVVAMFFAGIENEPVVRSIFYGLRPAIVGIIAAAGFTIGRSTIKGRRDVAVFVLALLALLLFKLHPILVIVLSGAFGIVSYLARRRTKDSEKELGAVPGVDREDEK